MAGVHEEDHHNTLNSTVAGSFLWLIDQVIARDVNYLTMRTEGTGLYQAPYHPVLADDVKRENVVEKLERECYEPFVETYHELENILVIKRVFRGRKSYEEFERMTCREFGRKLNKALKYLAKRLGLEKPPQFFADNPDALLFEEFERFNALDIVECNAMNLEVAVAQQYGEVIALEKVLKRATEGSFRTLFKNLTGVFPYDNESGFSTYSVLAVCVLSLSVPLIPGTEFGRDGENNPLSDPFALPLEDVLPWKVMSRFLRRKPGKCFSNNDLVNSWNSTLARDRTPLFTEKALWLRYPLVEGKDGTSDGKVDFSEAAFINLATHVIHEGIRKTLSWIELFREVLEGADFNQIVSKQIKLDSEFRRTSPVYRFEDQYWVNDKTDFFQKVTAPKQLEKHAGSRQQIEDRIRMVAGSLGWMNTTKIQLEKFFGCRGRPFDSKRHDEMCARMIETLKSRNPNL